jgi:hypothetical protein
MSLLTVNWYFGCTMTELNREDKFKDYSCILLLEESDSFGGIPTLLRLGVHRNSSQVDPCGLPL